MRARYTTMTRAAPILLTAAAALGAGSPPGPPAPEVLTLRECASLALRHNRDLAAARHAVLAAEARLRQAGLWPNPELEWNLESDGLFADEGEITFTAGFSQRFPAAHRLAKARHVGRIDVALTLAEIREAERDLVAEVTARGRALLVVREQLVVNDELRGALRELLDVAVSRAGLAEVSPTEVNLAKLELQRLDLARHALLTQRQSEVTLFNHLLGRPPGETLQLADPLEVPAVVDPLATGADGALARRPDRQLAALSIDRATAEIALARAERWEDWTIGFEYIQERSVDEPEGLDRDRLLGVTVSIPLPLFNRNQGRIDETLAGRRRALAELAALELRIETEIHEAWGRLRLHHARLSLFREGPVDLARENLTLLQRGYTEGLVGITTVLQAQRQRIEFQADYLGAVGDYYRALTDWETATATALPTLDLQNGRRQP